jgi:hypothetical protein
VRAPIATVTARGESFLQPGIHDVVFVTLGFEPHPGGPTLAHLHVSWLNPRKERRLVLVGSKKMVEFDDVAPDKLHIYDRGFDRPPDFASYAEYLTLLRRPSPRPDSSASSSAHLDGVLRTDVPRSGSCALVAAQASLDASRER